MLARAVDGRGTVARLVVEGSRELVERRNLSGLLVGKRLLPGFEAEDGHVSLAIGPGGVTVAAYETTEICGQEKEFECNGRVLATSFGPAGRVPAPRRVGSGDTAFDARPVVGVGSDGTVAVAFVRAADEVDGAGAVLVAAGPAGSAPAAQPVKLPRAAVTLAIVSAPKLTLVTADADTPAVLRRTMIRAGQPVARAPLATLPSGVQTFDRGDVVLEEDHRGGLILATLRVGAGSRSTLAVRTARADGTLGPSHRRAADAFTLRLGAHGRFAIVRRVDSHGEAELHLDRGTLHDPAGTSEQLRVGLGKLRQDPPAHVDELAIDRDGRVGVLWAINGASENWDALSVAPSSRVPPPTRVFHAPRHQLCSGSLTTARQARWDCLPDAGRTHPAFAATFHTSPSNPSR